MVKINYAKQYLLFTVPLVFYLIGRKLDHLEDERLSMFRDKSALYKRATPPEVPSW
ncbi:PREDICTED: uncharacterized protein LOC105362271 [Ceratosolen solmsi marchali]|uniref:Uncharacterized protein LOC105362271 n=1 Tax=Ceratosolen solmsi marchali TaxID=326594 RepID=A0AAJ7DVI8_9HYME|nr:PREDICTED: uncharacterized protein LOC105362271 [Ceratosolen solmsi marchali]